ncbi:MAG: 50S ribosomal protein L4 [Candidatus Methanomethyliaceae archaeon]|nr:50S ribosomal protein L4 [Candidatus Methanomethyliaceae archaeon]
MESEVIEKRSVPVYSLDGSIKGDVELPKVFLEEVRSDLIKRAFISSFTAKIQPKGRDPMAGKRTSAESLGVGLDLARVPRVKGGGPAAFVPNVVGGRLAFPPRPEKIFHERINDKERALALKSAIAATGIKDLVIRRGHIIKEGTRLPIVVSDEIKKLKKASEFREFLQKLNLWEDVMRAKCGIKERPGKGKYRGRRWVKPKTLLLITDELNPPVRLAARNFSGLDFAEVTSLNIERLAPGGHPGRLTIWTESALKKLEKIFT